MRVLLIEDDPSTAKSIGLTLATEGIICDVAELGQDGTELSKLYDYDIILLDLMLPDIDGYEVLLRLRAASIKIPILILSGLSSIDHKTKALGFGADDYLTKPFNRGELVVRIQDLVSRSRGTVQATIKFGKGFINTDRRTVEIGDQIVHLTNTEYAVLELLVMRKGTIVTKEMFFSYLYGNTKRDPDTKIINVYICKIREKLAKASGGINYIDTIWSRGHMLIAGDENIVQPAVKEPVTIKV